MDNYKKLFVLVLIMVVVSFGTIACNNTSEPALNEQSADEHPAGEHPAGDSADEHPAGEHPE